MITSCARRSNVQVCGGVRSERPFAREIHQEQAVAVVGERIEVVGELVMIQPRSAVQQDQRRPVGRAALDDPERAVVDPDEAAVLAHAPARPTRRARSRGSRRRAPCSGRFTEISSGVSVSAIRAIWRPPQSTHRMPGMSSISDPDERLRLRVVAHTNTSLSTARSRSLQRRRADRVQRGDQPDVLGQQRLRLNSAAEPCQGRSTCQARRRRRSRAGSCSRARRSPGRSASLIAR